MLHIMMMSSFTSCDRHTEGINANSSSNSPGYKNLKRDNYYRVVLIVFALHSKNMNPP